VTDLTPGQRVGDSRWPNGNTTSGGQGAPVGGLECVATPSHVMDIQTHVSIILNGEAQQFPDVMGEVRSGTPCFYPIHTHDGSGRLHVVGPNTSVVHTLGQAFAIWGQPLSNTDIAGITGLPVEVFVTDNGTVVKVEDATTWDDIELREKRLITIVVGTPITEIPNFNWSD
jgi:hypothetical protein